MTPKQRRFVDEYLIDLNATQAAIRAGYKASTARITGPENLSKPAVAAAIAAAQSKRAAAAELSAGWVLERLKAEATDCGDRSSHSARVAALKLLGQHMAMFVERHEHTGAAGGPIEVIEVVRPATPPIVVDATPGQPELPPPPPVLPPA